MITEQHCLMVTCDGKPGCDPWDDDPPHFASADEADTYLSSTGWVIVNGRYLCSECAREADCAATGHQLGDWTSAVVDGIPYRRRVCDHCGTAEVDPPRRDLSLLMHAAREMSRGETEA